MSTASYQNQDFVEQAHEEIQADRVAQREELERASETREALESDPEQAPAYAMTPGRQIGTVMHNIDGFDEPIEFGKPSGRATKTMLGPIHEMDREGAPLDDVAKFTWNLLGEWAIDASKDADYWADEISMIEAIQFARSVAMGGNAQALRR